MMNSNLYHNFFSTDEMRNIWSEEKTISLWLRVEHTLASVQAEMGLIPENVANAIGKIRLENIDIGLLSEEMKQVGRPIAGFVRQLQKYVGHEYGRFIHFGTTTQDIMDTATALQMQDGLDCIRKTLQRIITELEDLAKRHSETEMIGRTNGQWAIPITFGFKVTLWVSELKRRHEIIDACAIRALQVQLGGPVGKLKQF